MLRSTLVTVALLTTLAFASMASAQGMAGILGSAAGCAYVNVADAVVAAGAGDTILIQPGTHFQAIGNVGKSLTFTTGDATCSAKSTTSTATLDAGGAAQMLNATTGSSTRIENLHLTGGLAAEGGLIQVKHGILVLHDAELSHGRAWQGGCVHSHFTDVTLSGSTHLHDCDAIAGSGGGIYADGHPFVGQILLSDQSLISDSSAVIDGGGIAIVNSVLVLEDHARIQDCVAAFNGGGVYAYGGALLNEPGLEGASALTLLKDSVVMLDDAEIGPNNQAAVGGGIALRHDGGSSAQLKMQGRSRISGNVAGDGGGMAILPAPPATVPAPMAFVSKSSVVDSNVAHGDGGGAHLQSGRLFVIGYGELVGNSANRGGGAFIDSTTSLDVDGGAVRQNSAQTGGGIFADGGNIEVWNGIFEANLALADDGGAIHTNATLLVSSDSGCDAGGLPTDHYCTEFRGNFALKAGGAVYQDDGSASFEQVAFVGNAAPDGAALYQRAVSGVNLQAQHVLVADSFTGGSAVWAGGVMDILHMTLTNNQATGLYAGAASAVSFHRSIEWDHALGIEALRHVSLQYSTLSSYAGFPYPPLTIMNPKFVTTSRGKYRLGPASGQVDFAPATATHDLDDFPRPAGAGNDAGAFERP